MNDHSIFFIFYIHIYTYICVQRVQNGNKLSGESTTNDNHSTRTILYRTN